MADETSNGPGKEHEESVQTTWIGRMLVSHPKKIMAVLGPTLLLLIVVTFIVAPMNVVTGGDTFRSFGSRVTELQDAVVSAITHTEYAVDLAGVTVQPQRSRVHDALVVLYERKNIDSMFSITPDIRDVEDRILDYPQFSKFCIAPPENSPNTGACSRPFSALNYFYPTLSPAPPVGMTRNDTCLPELSEFSTCDALGSENVVDQGLTVDGVLGTVWDRFPGDLDQFVSPNFNPTEGEYVTHITKSLFSFGFPLEGFENDEEDLAAQEAAYRGFMEGMQSFLEDLGGDLYEVYAMNTILLELLFDEILANDSVFAILAILVVSVYMYFHTRSFFLTGLGMAHIVLSFPLAYVLFRLVLQQEYFGFLNFLALYILMSIGSDDVAIFVDTWRQSAFVPTLTTLELRMSYTWSRASKAMLVTSLTTSVAFFATAVSEIPPIRYFGVYSGVLICANYALVITWFPCVVVVWERQFAGRSYKSICQRCWPCCASPPNAVSDEEQQEEDDDDNSYSVSYYYATGSDDEDSGTRTLVGMDVDNNSGAPSTAPTTPRSHATSATLTTPRDSAAASTPRHHHEMQLKGVRGADGELVVRTACWGKIRGREGSPLGLTEQCCHWPYTKWTYKLRYPILAFFVITLIVFTAFGAQLGPAKEPSRFLADDHPVQKMLDLAQTGFLRQNDIVTVALVWGIQGVDRAGTDPMKDGSIGTPVYDRAFNPAIPENQQAMIDTCERARDGPLVLRREVYCPMEEFREYVETTVGGTFPVPEASFHGLLRNFSSATEETLIPGESGGFQGYTFRSGDTLGFDKHTGDLRFMLAIANLTLPVEAAAEKSEPVFKSWNAFMAGENARNPEGLNRGFQTSGSWVRMQTELDLLTGTFVGFAVSLAVCFIVILIASQNWWLSVMTILSIFWVVAAILGTMVVILGWDLGIIESISLTLLVGLSVDASAHIAHHYGESKSSRRSAKIQDSLREVGVSLVAAACTTALSAACLLPSTLIFFKNFGIFILLTILFSTFAAFGFWVSTAHIAGPEGDFGNLLKWRGVACCHCAGGHPDDEPLYDQ